MNLVKFGFQDMKMTGTKFRILIILSVFLSITGCAQPSGITQKVRTGSQQPGKWIPLLQGKKVGLVVNHTSLVNNVHLVDSMLDAGINVVRIFSPEHGLRGLTGAGDIVSDSTDAKTGLPVISLYGKKKKPSRDDLKGIDVVVYDIQDVGVRFYTYISTLHLVMEACADEKIPVLILDRPNPLGFYFDGPVLDTSFRSFVGMHPIPVVYGMTVGELAGMINNEGWLGRNLKCDLKVITCENYTHDSLYRLTVNPSPNLRSMEAVYLYPSMCFFEGTIMSIGRGTDYPFRIAGHPGYPDTSFSFIPLPDNINITPKFKGTVCYGIDLRMMKTTELTQLNQINLSWLIECYSKMKDGDRFFTSYFDQLAGTSVLRKQIQAGLTPDQIRDSWKAELDKFSVLRKKYLLYADFR